MQPSEALGVVAQVAVTLAGFAGIVVVFRPQLVHQWSVLDRFRLALLLMNSTIPLGFALFGMLLLSIDPAPLSIWRWCSGSFSPPMCWHLSRFAIRGDGFPAADLQTVNKSLFYGFAIVATAAAALQVVNFAVWNRFWPFFVVTLVHLSAAVIQFLRLLLMKPDDSGDAP